MPTLIAHDTDVTTDALPAPVRHTIVLGPTKASIVRAVARNLNLRRKRPVLTQFGIGSDGQPLSVYLTNVEAEAGYGIPLTIQGNLQNGALFTGHYNALTRSGYIDVITP